MHIHHAPSSNSARGAGRSPDGGGRAGMEYLIAALLVVAAFLIGILGNLIASELYDRAPSFAHWLLDRAVSRLGDEKRARYREEWFAHLDDCPGKLAKVTHAFGCLWSANRLITRVSPPRREEKCAPTAIQGSLFISDQLSPEHQWALMERELDHIRVNLQTDIEKVEVIVISHSYFQERDWASFFECLDPAERQVRR